MTNFQPGDAVIVTNAKTRRYQQTAVVLADRPDRMLPVLVRFADGVELAYWRRELAEAAADVTLSKPGPY